MTWEWKDDTQSGRNIFYDLEVAGLEGLSDLVVVEGSIIVGNATPAWEVYELIAPAAGIMNGLAVKNGETTPTWRDVRAFLDSETVKFGTGNDLTIAYDGTKGIIKSDNVAASDINISCGTDKTVVLDEVVWDDLRITPGSFDRPGSNDPSPVLYYPNGGGLGVQLYEFAKNDYACFTIQLPHTYKEGTDIYCHVHWTPGDRGNEENGATVGWKVDYTWANVNGTFGDMATLDLSDACDGTDHKHQMTPDVVIDGHTAAKGISSMLLCNIRRSDTGTDDTWASSTTGQLPLILEIDFHFQIDTLGSRQIGTK